MKIVVLGSAAGGGFPQWNCNCTQCSGFRSGSIQAQRRTQSSIAVTQNGQDWLLLNASPDIGEQLSQRPELQPARQARDTGIRAVMLMDSQIDHSTGLLGLRESAQRLPLYCTAQVKQDLSSGFPLLNMLSHYCGVDWHPINPTGDAFEVTTVPGLSIIPILVSSKAPPYSPHRNDPHPGDNIAVIIEDTLNGQRLLYAPGLGEGSEQVMAHMQSVHCLLVDGTCWRDDEMSFQGVGQKRASEMGHLAIADPGGSLDLLRPLSARKIYIHINNTNPILNDNSPERARLREEGIEVAFDGMEITL